ncbi:carbohydrate-binding protein [Streptomyces sp. YC504]|uniref:Carbohydrate-binding protein n=1 Tax=Streptomyces mesophilus TaxID=1775132 RepID=A0A6G4XDE8_9ACTN|nr:carbohydrate-binding protein [Streptomyces mesophilus]NGO74744.1 carbohydrate-binding protein [Streptomyces mesophilus]
MRTTKRTTLLRKAALLATLLATLVAGTASAEDPSPPGDTATAAASPSFRYNTFERPERGSAYDLGQWSQDGWYAPWEEGMSTRTWIDGYNFHHSGGKSLRVFYPKGKIGPADSGAQAPLQLNPGREYYLSYWVRFSSDFSWGTTEYAGKVGIGLAGGASCSGGQVCDGYNGFSSRMIWRSGGKAAIYYYHMGHEGQYGDYVDLKDASGNLINWPRGQWANVVQRVKVNTVSGGNANPDGEIDIWYNGAQAATIRGLRFVRNGDLVDRAYFSSFFGGATPSFAPTNDSYIWYDDLKVSTQRSDVCELASGGCHSRSFQAEDYSAMKGVTKKTTSDTGGGQAVGSFDSTDWIAFQNVAIPKAGRYLVEYRVASPHNGGTLSLDLGGGATALGNVSVPNTGSYDSYRTISREVELPAGTHQFGLYAVTGGFDLNWWKITQIS